MDLTHRLRVPAPLDEVWAVVNDPRRVAGVLPGTVVDSVDGDGFTATTKIKLASRLLALAGSGRYTARDEAARRVVVTTTGSDRRGDAGVEATHTLTLRHAAGSAAQTDVTVATAMTWTGRPARLGDGVVADALDRVLEQAEARIAARVAEGRGWAPESGAGRGRGSSAESVVDHPVELGEDLGDVDDAPAPEQTPDRPAPSPRPSPLPGPSPRPARADEYVYRPYDNAAEPHLDAARTFSRVVLRRAAPYAGLGALAVLGAVTVLRRLRRVPR